MTDCHLYSLPNELLLQILVPIPTPQLLPLTVLSHRIYSIILRILQNRLVAASELGSHSLLLECYHPSAKFTEPPLFCTYNGTDGLSRYSELSTDYTDLPTRLGELRNMYSRFQPHRREFEAGGWRVRGPPGDVPGSRTFPFPGTTADKFKGESVRQIVGLDSHELFTQLCAQSFLFKIGPRDGVFTASVEVEEGVVRVWREWLKDMAAKRYQKSPDLEDVLSEGSSKGKYAVEQERHERHDPQDKQTLWVSASKNTGLRFNVKERRTMNEAPILIRADEDAPVSYEVEYKGTHEK
ncbi:hypothetical protein B0J11DRAFT_533011 [Dendryphion nanum]|uniref:F-box domain-containing protein n=1 Tax=Dendryphion nanum TaxID=256645 RepID=A0A9P9DK44_9PLEO|nr:hypothetical protein B0J11DRAFT_533011 [Dendryphion nanum]